jgi:peptidoglycan/LPS O-acetylase OafA/YrhL
LDVLRLFAFLGVYLFHSYAGAQAVQSGPPWVISLNRLNSAGVFGVDLFFALSAYLITELLLREKRQFGELNVKAFYLRRMLRIWPLYFFAIALALIPFFDADRAFTWRYATSFLLLAGNWCLVAWGWPAGFTIANPLWTVSIEEQFYLVWPPIVRKLSIDRLAHVAIGMLVVATSARATMVAIHAGRFAVWANTLCRLDPIALGILVAVVLRGRIPHFSISARIGMLLAGVLMTTLVANAWNLPAPLSLKWLPNLVGFPLVAVSCMLILLAVLGVPIRFPWMLVYLGKISYGLYVYHMLGFFLTGKFLVRGHLNHFRWLVVRQSIALTITILLASVSYALIEKPFLNLKKRFELVRSRPV